MASRDLPKLSRGDVIRRRPSTAEPWGPPERVVRHVAYCVTDLGLPFEDRYTAVEIETAGGTTTIHIRPGMIGRTILIIDD